MTSRPLVHHRRSLSIAVALLVAFLALVVWFPACEWSDEMHITGRQAGAEDFRKACAPAKVESVAGDETFGLVYNVTCSDGRIEEVDDRLPE